jgi:hypothetical protein
MEKRGWLLLMIIVVSISFVSAGNFNLFFNGDLNFEINEVSQTGEKLISVFELYNGEKFPIADGHLIINIVKGCEEPTYPSQNSDCDSVIYEEVISGINLAPLTSKKINFSYILPEDLSSGTYRVDAYFRTSKTPIIGMAHIFLPGKSKSFEIVGNGIFPSAKISRINTGIKGYPGPIGVGTNFDEEIYLNLAIDSEVDKNFKVKLTTFNWEDSVSKNALFTNERLENLKKGENKIPIKLDVPQNSGAYAIRIELLDEGRLVSLYRSRLIVYGEDAKIRKMYPHKAYYEDEDATISLLIAGSPDHYSNPITEDLSLEVILKNNIDGKEYFKSEKIGDLGGESEADFFYETEVKIPVKGKLINFDLCSRVFSKDKTYDEYCYTIDSKEFESSNSKITLEGKYERDIFSGEICVFDLYTDLPVKTNLFLFLEENGNYLSSQSKEHVSCSEINFSLKPEGNYSLRVQNKNTGEEKIFDLKEFYKKEEVSGRGLAWGIFIILLIISLIIIIKIIKFFGRNKK